MQNEIGNIQTSVKQVAESLSHFMQSGHLGDNISHLYTNASTLKILAEKLKAYKDKIKDFEHYLYKEDEFKYQLLSRMQGDCEYYLGNGGRYNRHLWALDEELHIQYMIALHNSFPDDAKPEWLTMEQILEYAEMMLNTNY